MYEMVNEWHTSDSEAIHRHLKVIKEMKKENEELKTENELLKEIVNVMETGTKEGFDADAIHDQVEYVRREFFASHPEPFGDNGGGGEDKPESRRDTAGSSDGDNGGREEQHVS
jgi:hypothetical protein